jgi:hypothetical protein
LFPGGMLSMRRRISSSRAALSFFDLAVGDLAMVDTPIRISKLDAARRQLQTAIRLWFHDGDPVSIHTLAFAAYEIIHVIAKARNKGLDLLFDTLNIKDEHRRDFNAFIKRDANFFKHAKKEKNLDEILEFRPVLTMLFLIYATLGVRWAGETPNEAESIFFTWLHIHKSNWLTDEGRKFIQDNIPIEHLDEFRAMPKAEFFDIFAEARKSFLGKAL